MQAYQNVNKQLHFYSFLELQWYWKYSKITLIRRFTNDNIWSERVNKTYIKIWATTSHETRLCAVHF